MEDDLQKMEDEPINLIGCDTKTASKKLKKIEDDLIFFWKTRMTTSKKMEDDLKKMEKKWKTT